MRKLSNGGVAKDELDLLFLRVVRQDVKRYLGLKDKNLKQSLTELLRSKPETLLKKLNSIPNDPRKRGIMLQVVYVEISSELFKIISNLCDKYNLDFIDLVSEYSTSKLTGLTDKTKKRKVSKSKIKKLPKELQIYVSILSKLNQYEEKTEQFYRTKKQDSFLIPELYYEEIRKNLLFLLNPSNGRWAIVDDISFLNPEKWVRRAYSPDVVQGDLLILPKEILSDEEREFFRALVANGVIYQNRRIKIESPDLTIQPSLLSIVVTTYCNFRCKYCYEEDFKPMRPDLENMERTISRLFSKYPTIKTVSFFGGEPLLEFEAIRRLTFNPFIYGLPKSIQTNGSLINEEIARYFKLHKFGVGISLDGPDDYNKLRILPTGENTYEKILEGIDKLKYVGVMFGLLSTYTKDSEGLEKEYISWISELNPSSFGVNVGVHRKYLPSWRSTLKFFQTTFEAYVNSDIWTKIRYNTFLYHIDVLLLPPKDRSLMLFRNPCGAGRSHITVNPDGSLSPCPELFMFKSYDLNFFDKFKPVYTRVVESMCPACPFRYICTGGCPGKSIVYHGRINKPLEELCKFRKRFFVWLASKLYEDKKYLEVYKHWKKNLKVNQITLEP